MPLIAIGCSSTERLNKAATVQGQIAAGVNLPAWPDDCRKQEPHASIAIGDELRAVLVRERGALDRQNARTVRCTAFEDDVRGRFAGLQK